MKKIYIVILNYNGINDTLICLESLKKLGAEGYQLKTVVVDNASNDGSVEKLKMPNGQWKIDKLIINKKNLGYAGGNNKGIQYALDQGADYVLVLNNDTKATENYLPRLLKLDADVASPIVKFKESPESNIWLYDYGGFVNWWTGRTYHCNKDHKLKTKNQKPIPVDYIAGCCMLIKSKVFETVGLFDETYFIYFEDVDFCITAKKSGFSVLVDPNSVIYHKLGGSMDRWSGRAIYYNLLGNLIFITKQLGLKRPIGYLYLSFLTAKILKDRLLSVVKS